MLRLIGYTGPADPPLEGDVTDLGLFWQAPSAPGADFTAVLQGVGADGKSLFEQPIRPVEQLATGRWQSGDLFVGWQRVRVPTDVPGGQLRLRVGVRDAAGAWLATPGGTGPYTDVGSLTVRARSVNKQAPVMQQAVGTDLGGRIRLLGYDVDASNARPGGTVKLTLYWQALDRIDRSYKVFSHLESGGKVVAQRDSEPADGAIKTTVWKPGEVVADPQPIPIAIGTAPGDYQLVVGMYDPKGGARLPVQGGGDFVNLMTVRVGA